MTCKKCGQPTGSPFRLNCDNCEPRADFGYPPQITEQIHVQNKPKQIMLIILVTIIGLSFGSGGFFLFYIFIMRSPLDYDILQATDEPIDVTPEPVPSPTPSPTLTPAVAIGDIIQFGSHNWRVLDIQDSQILIITENIINTNQYSISEATWERSDIREYLNSIFFYSFSESERGYIQETIVINNNNPWFGISGGNNTIDRIFLLSIEELVQYFGDSGRLAHQNHINNEWWGFNDEYGYVRIAFNGAGEDLWWWLRSPGNSPFNTAVVRYSGHVDFVGLAVYDFIGVRPALWLCLGFVSIEEEIYEAEPPVDIAEGVIDEDENGQTNEYEQADEDVQISEVTPTPAPTGEQSSPLQPTPASTPPPVVIRTLSISRGVFQDTDGSGYFNMIVVRSDGGANIVYSNIPIAGHTLNFYVTGSGIIRFDIYQVIDGVRHLRSDLIIDFDD